MSRNRLDLVLVNPGSRFGIYQALGKALSAVEPPVWAGLMATYLRKKGFSVQILDAEAADLSAAQTAERIVQQDPLLTAVVVYGHQPSASTQNMTGAGAICSALKKIHPEGKVMLVGGHVAALPERTLREEAVDFVADGEGPVTLLDLLTALNSAPHDLSQVRGLLFWEDGNVRANPPAPLMRDLDGEMPEVAWDLLPMDRYRAHNWHCLDGLKRQPYAAIYTTLGCPYHCSFCLRKGTSIITAQGRNKKIEDLHVGDTLMAWDEEAGRLSETTITATGNRWVDKLLRIRMRTGETIEITHEHPVYTSRGWVDAGDLQNGDAILLMDKGDKLAYLRRFHNPARRPEVRMKISTTLKQQHETLSERMKILHAQGRIPYVPMSEERKRELSQRMKRDNPMRKEEVARKVREILKKRIAAGELIPYLNTDEGKYVSGGRHWAWQGGISEDPYPPQFSSYLKRKIRKRDGYTCRNCGRKEALTVHHIDYNKDNCAPCNLITVCVSCNSKANAGRERWKAHYVEKMMAVGNCPHLVPIETMEEIEGEFQVFNFQCSPHDNYFAERFLVHNCCIQAPFKSGEQLLGYKESVNTYRFWSPDAVIAQIDKLVTKYGVRNIKFADEMFVLNPRHVIGICDRIIERGYDLNIWAYARVDTVQDGMVEKLKKAGVHWLAFGIEAASERVRDDVQKGFGQKEIFETLAKVRAAGINVIGNYIFGLPEDTLETMQETLDLALELNCEFANFYSAMAYPGSQLYNLAVKEGWPLPETWRGYSQHSVDTLPLPTKHLSAGEVLKFRDQAFQAYYRSPRYLEMVRQKFGEETAQHIQEMASHRLIRKHLPQEVVG